MITSEIFKKAPAKIYVNEFLVDLIPGFIKNKTDDLATLKAAIENKDSDTINPPASDGVAFELVEGRREPLNRCRVRNSYRLRTGRRVKP